jgi:hypothetical protein
VRTLGSFTPERALVSGPGELQSITWMVRRLARVGTLRRAVREDRAFSREDLVIWKVRTL